MPCPDQYPSKTTAAAQTMLALLMAVLAGCNRELPSKDLASVSSDSGATATVDTGGDEAVAVTDAGRIRQWLVAANAAFKAGRLAAPADDNALAYLLAVVERDPVNRAAFELLVDLTPMVASTIEARLALGDLDQARPALALLARASPDSLIVQSLRQKLASAEQRLAARTATSPAQAVAPTTLAGADLATPAPRPLPSHVATAMPAANRAQVPVANPAATAAAIRSPPTPARHRAVPVAVAEPPPAAVALPAVSSEPVAISKSAPQYPDAARKRRTEGWVDLQFVVNANGEVEAIEVIAAEPNGVFERSAERAVQRWKFKPAERDGKPVPARVRTRVGFRLG